jgi:hypothetical protein
MSEAVIIPATRKEAIRLGLTRYLGSPCLSGHHSGRQVSNRGCMQCQLSAKHKKTKVGQLRDLGIARVGDVITLSIPSNISITIVYRPQERTTNDRP